ncbi:MAG: hypothetical protein FJ290_00235 [Planctomycetes bacterium]|nr:hypothetical protein [Planctomycetota bacterium]
MRRSVSLALVGLCLAGCVFGDVIYQYDDGTQDAAAGQGLAWDFFWLNRFDRQAGGEVITEVAIYFDLSMPAGAPFRAVLWNDSGSSGDPADARVAALLDAVATGSGTRWVVADIPDTLATPYFFVGGYIGTGVAAVPAAIEDAAYLPPYGGGPFYPSYVGGSSGGGSDLDNLPSADQAGWYVDLAGYEWVNMVRATGIPAPAAAIPEPTSMTLLALAGLALLRRTRHGCVKRAR